jgi:hypothetical protein
MPLQRLNGIGRAAWYKAAGRRSSSPGRLVETYKSDEDASNRTGPHRGVRVGGLASAGRTDLGHGRGHVLAPSGDATGVTGR